MLVIAHGNTSQPNIHVACRRRDVASFGIGRSGIGANRTLGDHPNIHFRLSKQGNRQVESIVDISGTDPGRQSIVPPDQRTDYEGRIGQSRKVRTIDRILHLPISRRQRGRRTARSGTDRKHQSEIIAADSRRGKFDLKTLTAVFIEIPPPRTGIDAAVPRQSFGSSRIVLVVEVVRAAQILIFSLTQYTVADLGNQSRSTYPDTRIPGPLDQHFAETVTTVLLQGDIALLQRSDRIGSDLPVLAVTRQLGVDQNTGECARSPRHSSHGAISPCR